jgi:DNA primase
MPAASAGHRPAPPRARDGPARGQVSIDTEALKRANPIAQVVQSYGVKLRQAGKYLKGLCPFHSERDESFTVDEASDRWRCFGRCSLDGRWRDVIDFVGIQEYGAAWNARNADMFVAVAKRLGGAAPAARPAPPAAPPREPKIELTPQVLYLLNKTGRMYHATLMAMGAGPSTPREYLHQRGFSDATLQAHLIGYCPGADTNVLLATMDQIGFPVAIARQMRLLDEQHGDREFLRGRIVFPCMGEQGRIVHLAGRKWASWVWQKAPKYLSLYGLPKPIYGLAGLDPARRAPVLITESLPDWLTLRQWDYDAVAMLGTALTPRHADLLRRVGRPLVYVPQNDESGVGLAAVTAWRAMVGQGVIMDVPVSVKDINDLLVTGRRGDFEAALARVPLT